jgi:DNA-binding CsgD family transcriptional regulator
MTRSGGFTYKHGRLAPRERECARLIADCLTNQEIASEMGVAVKTAENYVNNLSIYYGLTALGNGIRPVLIRTILDDMQQRKLFGES